MQDTGAPDASHVALERLRGLENPVLRSYQGCHEAESQIGHCSSSLKRKSTSVHRLITKSRYWADLQKSTSRMRWTVSPWRGEATNDEAVTMLKKRLPARLMTPRIP